MISLQFDLMAAICECDLGFGNSPDTLAYMKASWNAYVKLSYGGLIICPYQVADEHVGTKG